MIAADRRVLSRAANLAERLFEERMLVITARTGTLHRFNEVGTFIWGLLEKPRRVGEIVDAVAAGFEGFDKKEGCGEIGRFLEMLREKGLVRIDEVPGVPEGRG